MFLRLIKRWPYLGLLLALSIEAWIPVPGEALIAAATARVCALSRTIPALRAYLAAMVGMTFNDFALLAISRVARGLTLHFVHVQQFHTRLDGALMLIAKFVPPLRSSAALIYGFQGVSAQTFLAVSLLSSTVWVLCYVLIGTGFRNRLQSWIKTIERKTNRWVIAAEIVLTVASMVLVFQPF